MRAEVCTRGLRRGAWRQSANDVERPELEPVRRISWKHGDPEVGTTRVVESFSHHADDRVGPGGLVDTEALPQDSRVTAKLALPRGVAQHRDRLRAELIVSRTERPA